MVKHLFPRTLMGRALLIIVLPFLLMQVLSAYVFYESHWDQVSKKLARGLAGEIALLVEALDELPEPDILDWLYGEATQHLDLVASLERDGILPNTPWQQTQIEGELRRALLYRGITNPFRVDAVSERDAITVSIQLPEGVLHITAPRTRLFSRTTSLFVLWMVGTSLLLLGVAALFMRHQVRPVKRLARVADAFGKGRDIADFTPEGAREVRLAGRAFLAMRNRIKRQIAQRTAMLSGVSHDLRTPLTRMKLELEMMRTNRAVAALKQDIAEMEQMLESYLAFARGEGTEAPVPSDLSALVAETVRQACRNGAHVEYRGEKELVLPLRPVAVSRCVANLIDNAVKSAKRIRVEAARRGASVEVLVDDDGPGIPADSREEVFKPFVRLDGPSTPHNGGIGLGLTIARDIARSHGGDLSLEDSPLGGLRARLSLPL